MPHGQRIDHRAGAQRGDEAIDLRQLHQQAVEQAAQPRQQQHHQHRQWPGQAQLGLQADGQDVPEHDAEADVEVDLADDHRNGGGERQQRHLRLGGQDGLQRQQRGERRRRQRKQHDEQHTQDEQTVTGARLGEDGQNAVVLQADALFESGRFDR